jgi:hypothetical protein
VLNTVVEHAGLFGSKVADGAAAASAVVGLGCIWVNT